MIPPTPMKRTDTQTVGFRPASQLFEEEHKSGLDILADVALSQPEVFPPVPMDIDHPLNPQQHSAEDSIEPNTSEFTAIIPKTMVAEMTFEDLIGMVQDDDDDETNIILQENDQEIIKKESVALLWY